MSATKGLACLLTSIAVTFNMITVPVLASANIHETIDKFGETTTFEYDEASRPEKMIYDTGAYALYTYDGRSRIKAVEHKNSSNTLLRKETNVYDPASRITSRYEGPASGGVTTTFTYDDVGQLTGESASGYSASYTYDANGNRTNRTVNSQSETYTVDDADKLTSVTWSNGLVNYSKEYSYHYSGRVTGITYKTNGVTTSSETLTWNKENRLISRGTDTYTYNGLNTRVAKSDSGGSFTYRRAGAGQTAPVLHDGAANYLPGLSEKRSGTSTFLHSGIKNGQLQTNSSQSNTATNRYDAFGNVLAQTGTWKGPFGYGGEFGYQTDKADMELLGDRYYDPTIGRFLSRDAAQDGRNWYVYCASSPPAFADQTGRAYANCAPDTPTVLYKLVNSKTGELFKWGITSQHPMFRRYTKLFYEVMGLKMVDVMSGPRHRMLRAERLFIKLFPGPGNKEVWRGPRGSGGVGGRGLGIIMAVPTAVDVATEISITGARHASRYNTHLEAIDDPSLEGKAKALEGVDEEYLPD